MEARVRRGGGGERMSEVRLEGVSRVHADGTVAVAHVDLTVRDGELVSVLGPSGCGKSTLLRLIAGLDPLSGGHVAIGGRVVDDVPTAERDVAMAFEADAVYPHLSAYGNVRWGLELRGTPEPEIRERVGAVSRVLGLSRFLHRRPAALSAGQRQRVALGRAAVRTPAVLLLDDPLSHLDAAERPLLRAALAAFRRDRGVTTVYVTHDQADAMALGDRVAVMRAGRIEQVDPPSALYLRPANTFVAGFVGEPGMSLLPGWLETEGGRGWAVVGRQRLPLPAPLPSALAERAGTPVTVGIRPEHLTETGGGAAVLFTRASTVEHRGGHQLVGCAVGELTVTARLPHTRRVRAGDRLELAVDVAELSYFDPLTGEAIHHPAEPAVEG
jgi:multiple sugar transport system ATP-binding protein